MKRHDPRSSQSPASPNRRPIEALRDAWVFAQTRPLATLATLALLLIVTVALMADVVATHDPLAQNVAQRLRPPGADHYFGTDGFGRDVFSRVVHGARVSMYVGLLAIGMAAIAGICVGTV